MTQPGTVLIIGQEFDPTADHVVALLRGVGAECVRWPTSMFPMGSSISLTALGSGCLRVGKRRIALEDVRSVWSWHPAPFTIPSDLIAEERRFAEAEARAILAALTHQLRCLWVNHPDATRAASCKALQLRTAHDLGLRIPATLMSNDPGDVLDFISRCRTRVVYKAFSSGLAKTTGEASFTTPVDPEHVEKLDLIRNAPGIFQELIPKKFDLRITVIGRRVFATEIHSQSVPNAIHDWRAADVASLAHKPHELPSDVRHSCVAVLERLGLAYGAIDMVVTPDDEYVFLENNPSGQFGWIESTTGVPLTQTLAAMLVSGRVD